MYILISFKFTIYNIKYKIHKYFNSEDFFDKIFEQILTT